MWGVASPRRLRCAHRTPRSGSRRAAAAQEARRCGPSRGGQLACMCSTHAPIIPMRCAGRLWRCMRGLPLAAKRSGPDLARSALAHARRATQESPGRREDCFAGTSELLPTAGCVVWPDAAAGARRARGYGPGYVLGVCQGRGSSWAAIWGLQRERTVPWERAGAGAKHECEDDRSRKVHACLA